MNVYDFDGTIYEGDSTVDFYLFALKHNISLIRYVPKQALGFLLYILKRIGKTELKEYFFSFLPGINAEKLADAFWAKNHDKIYRWYLEQQQTNDVIISASPEFLLKPICQRLGIHHLIASRVDVQSGKFSGENCRGKEKFLRFLAEYHETHIDRFYSDSPSDLPLAQMAEHAFLVKKGHFSVWNHKTDYSKKET